MELSAELALELRELEESLLSPAVRSDPAKVSALLDDDFLEFGASGTVYDKAGALETLAAARNGHLALAHFSARALSEDVALVTYRAAFQETVDASPRYSLRVSIWRRTESGWRILFHQGTAVGDTQAGRVFPG